MPYVNLDQACFTNGVLDPRAYARTDFDKYYRSVKTAMNCVVIPQGGIQRRFGTRYIATLDPNINPYTNPEYTEISTLTFDDSAIYLLVWQTNQTVIFLEDILVASFATPYNKEDIVNLRWAQVNDRIITANLNFNPYQLVRSANAPNAIVGLGAAQTLTITTPGVIGQVLPITFSTTGVLPTSNPQIYVGRTYYALFITTTTIQIYSTADAAKSGVGFYTFSAAGVTSTVNILNTWTFTAINFIAEPAFDFNGGYSALTFTPSATSGTGVTITASAPIFTAAMVGGLFTGNGGIFRIQTFNSTTVVTGFTIQSFTNTNAIMGAFAFLGEPAWSTARGWPVCVSFFQNRLVFGGSPSIPNGVWLSAVNVAYNFDDSETLASDAISWYPSAAQTNVVQALTAGKTLTVHTNTGNYFTPFATEQPLTPTNFVLTEQNKDGTSNLQPLFIDNQIIYVDKSGNNVKNMTWDIAQSSYVLNNISIASSSLIISPVDMAAFTDPNFTDGYYAMFVNSDGSLAIFQTLSEQNIAAWTNATAQYTFDNVTFGFTGGFNHITSSIGRVFFIVDRHYLVPQAPVAITGFNAVNNTLQANGHGLEIGHSNIIYFTTTGVLPLTVPPINTTQYFFANATDANNFRVYALQSDAESNINAFTIINAGNNSNVIDNVDTHAQFLEELDFTLNTDASTTVNNLNSNVINNANYLNGDFVGVFADGVSLGNIQIFNNVLTLPVVSQNVTYGMPFNSTIQFLPIGNIPGTPSNLYKRKHIRGLYINCYNTLGATIQGFPIIIPQQIPAQLGQPVSGVYEYNMMEDWDYTQYNITISQMNPLPMTILGISYILELT
jgi:hypothetical protein